MKKCTKCKEIKELECFNKSQSSCRKCQSIYWKQYYKNNKVRLAKNTIQWKKNNPEKVRITKQKEHLKNRDKYIERWNESYYKDIEESRKKNNQYRKDNVEIIRERDRIRGAKKRNNLTDQYVKEVLVKRTNLKTSDISDELIKIGREYIKLRRDHFQLIKVIKNG